MAGAKATSAFPGAREHDFVRCCQIFLLGQIRTQQPQLMPTLGVHVPQVLAPLAPELASVWNRSNTFVELDSRSVALVSPVHFPDVSQPVTVAALIHPSQRRLNVKLRAYRDKSGDAAAVELLQDALACVDPSCLDGASA
jgi:hypothetical protein